MYTLATRTSWQKKPTKFQIHDIRHALKTFPVIEQKFFDDLIELCRKKEHYFVEMGLIQLAFEKQKILNTDFWILIWATDFKDRLFQLLIERHPETNGKGSLAGVSPPDFLEFISSMKKNAILPTLSLINSPDKMKSVGVIVSRPKGYDPTQKTKVNQQALNQFGNWINNLKSTPNLKGKWFPSSGPPCPICQGNLVELHGPDPGMKSLVCTQCGAIKPIYS
jgi:hypothetical protein